MAGIRKGISGYVLGLMLLAPSAGLMVLCWLCPCLWLYKYWTRKPLHSPTDSTRRVRQSVNVEFPIPESVVGFVIGRRGTSVKQVEEQTGTRIQFKDKQDSQDKMVVITGRAASVQAAQELIQSTVREKLSSVKNQQTATLTLPRRAVGRVIGRGGANIRGIQRESGARVTMLSGTHSDTVRLCEVLGNPEQVARAVAMIQEQVSTVETRPQRSGQTGVASKTGRLEELCLTPAIEFLPVFVSNVDGQGGVWVQPISLEDPSLLEALVADMTEYYTSFKDHPFIKEGALYAAPFKNDDNWYRVKVVRLTESSVEVLYVDYGDYDSIDSGSLRSLRPEDLTLRAQAVRCVLDNIIPTDGVWSESGLTALEELTYSGQWRVVMARVTSTLLTPRVQLVDTSADNDVNIAEALVAAGQAVYARETPLPHSLRYQVHSDTPYLPYSSHVTLPSQSECSITYAQSPDLIFVRPIGYDILLSQLCVRMNYEYKSCDDRMERIGSGDLIALCLPLDTQWYRGHVISYNQSDSSVLIRLLDYGIVVCVPETQVRPLKAALSAESAYCAACSLADIQPVGVWTDESAVLLREAVNRGVVTVARVSGDKAIPSVRIDIQDKGVSLASELVAAGLAVEVKGRLEPDGGEEFAGEVNKNVRFRWSSAETVSVAGSFSDWNPVELKRRETGEFETDLDIPSGKHEYKYYVDGVWVHDQSQPTTFNNYGTLNNIVDT